MTRRVLRVGGVNEPFNLPWIRAFEANAFAHLGVEVTFTMFAGGTGAMVGALEDGEIDMATLLSEGAVTAIAQGRGVRLHSAFTTSPLLWGIHVAAGSSSNTVEDLRGQTFAISRYGSGSELMAYVLAEQHGWVLGDDHFSVVGGVDGAIEALPNGTADIFLWERFVTAPLVEQGIFKRVGDLPTPWPAFYTAARADLGTDDAALITQVVQIVLDHAAELTSNPQTTVDEIVERHGMNRADAESWLAGVTWPSEPSVDEAVLSLVMATMADLGRIDTPIPVAALLL